MAPAYLPFPGQDDITITAILTLPLASRNKDWYCNWLMVVGRAENVDHQVFAQVGEIRRPTAYSDEHAFISWQTEADRMIHYRDLGALSDRPHRFSLFRLGNDFLARIDDGEPMAISALSISSAYAQVGPEAFADGDNISGTVESVQTSSKYIKRSFNMSNACRLVNRGVSLVPRGSALVASGQVDDSKGSKFIGDCSWFHS
jgi:hypothetical protein